MRLFVPATRQETEMSSMPHRLARRALRSESIKRFARIALAFLPVTVASCSQEAKPNRQIAQEYARLCSAEGMLDEANRTKWLEMTAAIDRGEIRREQVSLGPQTPTFSSDDRNSLEAQVEASLGDVTPVAGSKTDDDSALFQGPIVVLLNGERLLEFRDLYLATDSRNWISVYGQAINVRSCFLDRGDKYWSYIGRQK